MVTKSKPKSTAKPASRNDGAAKKAKHAKTRRENGRHVHAAGCV